MNPSNPSISPFLSPLFLCLLSQVFLCPCSLLSICLEFHLNPNCDVNLSLNFFFSTSHTHTSLHRNTVAWLVMVGCNGLFFGVTRVHTQVGCQERRVCICIWRNLILPSSVWICISGNEIWPSWSCSCFLADGRRKPMMDFHLDRLLHC